MFFTTELLSKRDSGIGLLWMAATLGKTSISKLNRRNILKADIAKLCELVAEPAEPLALRLSSNLLVGVVRVYKEKHNIFLSEVTNCFTSLKRTLVEISAAETSAALNLASGSVRPDAITLSMPEGGIGMNIDVGLSDPIWEDFFVPFASRGHQSSPSPGITSQDFTGTQTQTQTQTQRPLYTLDEPYEHLLATNEEAQDPDPIDLGLGLGMEDFDLGLGQDAFGDSSLFDDLDPMELDSPTKQRKRAKPKSTMNVGAGVDIPVEAMYARDLSVPVEPLDLDDWAFGIQASSSGFGFLGSGGPGLSSSRPGSRLQAREPQGAQFEQQGPVEGAPEQAMAGERDGAIRPTVPKKSKKGTGIMQDKRTELTNDELSSNRNNYLKEQKRLRIEGELRRQERDAARVVDVWMEGVPYGLNCPELEEWFKQSFKALVGEDSRRRKRDEDHGFVAPPLPAKRRREDTPSQGAEIGRRVGTPMDRFDFGEDMNLGAGMDFDIPRSSSVEAPEVAMRESQAGSQTGGSKNTSQQNELFPWDNMGDSLSMSGGGGSANMPRSEANPLEIDGVALELSSPNGSGSDSATKLSASPGGFGTGLEAFERKESDLAGATEQNLSQTEAAMELQSRQFFKYVRATLEASRNSKGIVMFSELTPDGSSPRVAATAFYHTLALATKSVIRVAQPELFSDISIQLPNFGPSF